ncbi:MAG: adenylosuccinate lyase [bacterium]
MIERYSLPGMKDLWSRENRYRNWLKVELAVCRAYYRRGTIPAGAMEEIESKADFDIDEIDRIENEVKHDVIAFLTSVANHVGDSSRFIHMGLTSSDVLDTANALLLRDASDMIIESSVKFRQLMFAKAKEYKRIPVIGRSHGIHAEPTTIGLKMLTWVDDLDRAIALMKEARDNVARGKISGAVGNYANVSPDIEEEVMNELGLKAASVSSQIVSRDVYTDYIYAIARIASVLSKAALQIRLLQRTETRELEEPFTSKQKGSSAMPHKRNPVICERICGLTRIIKNNLTTALDNINLWDERDISHSSAERIIMPDCSILIDYMLNKMQFVISNMKIYPENALRNIDHTNGLIYSQKALLKMIETGITREKAYRIIQENAMKSWEDKTPLRDLLLNDKRITAQLSAGEIESIFDIEPFLKNIEIIFNRFGE